METRVLTVDPKHPEPRVLAEAAEVLRAGHLVAFPTETVYGLGANALDATALASIYEAKRRPANDPIIAHIAHLAQLDLLARDIPDAARALAEAFWPGPLTLVLQRAPGVPANIAAGRDTIAIRMPAHPVARALLLAVDLPVGAPSANTFTRPSATTADHVLEDLDGRIDLLLDGGPASIGVESTVVDLTGPEPRVLRPGGVPLEALRAVLPGILLAPGYLAREESADAPGQLLKHYSPTAAVMLFTGPVEAVRARMRQEAQAMLAGGHSPGLLLATEDLPTLRDVGVHEVLGGERDFTAISRRLFEAMRTLDRSRTDAILVRDFGREGLGAAIWDRLLRAAEGQVIDVSG